MRVPRGCELQAELPEALLLCGAGGQPMVLCEWHDAATAAVVEDGGGGAEVACRHLVARPVERAHRQHAPRARHQINDCLVRTLERGRHGPGETGSAGIVARVRDHEAEEVGGAPVDDGRAANAGCKHHERGWLAAEIGLQSRRSLTSALGKWVLLGARRA